MAISYHGSMEHGQVAHQPRHLWGSHYQLHKLQHGPLSSSIFHSRLLSHVQDLLSWKLHVHPWHTGGSCFHTQHDITSCPVFTPLDQLFRTSWHWPVLRHWEQSCRSFTKVRQVSRRKKRSNFCTSCGGHRRMSFTQFWSLYCLPYKTPIQNAMLHHVYLMCPQSIKGNTAVLLTPWCLQPASVFSHATLHSSSALE